MEEYLLRRTGKLKARKIELQQEWQHFRILSRYTIMPYLDKIDKGKPLDKLVPDIYEEIKEEKGLKARYARMKQQAIKLGILNKD